MFKKILVGAILTTSILSADFVFCKSEETKKQEAEYKKIVNEYKNEKAYAKKADMVAARQRNLISGYKNKIKGINKSCKEFKKQSKNDFGSNSETINLNIDKICSFLTVVLKANIKCKDEGEVAKTASDRLRVQIESLAQNDPSQQVPLIREKLKEIAENVDSIPKPSADPTDYIVSIIKTTAANLSAAASTGTSSRGR